MLSRREFLASTAAVGATLATGLQPAQAQKRVIVDSQVHLWKADSEEFRWTPGAKPQLPEPFTIERAVKLMDEAGVNRAVLAPAGVARERNDYLLEAAKRYPNRFGVMGSIPLDNPKAAALLPKWRDQPGMLGVRLNLNDAAAMASVKDGTADYLWAGAEKHSIPVMFFAAGQVSTMAPIAGRYPGLVLIIDHMGVNAGIAKKKALPEAIGQVVALAKNPNVGVKLSNLPNSSLEPYPFKDLNEHIKRVFDAFGPQRCYWGTDVTNGMGRSDWKQRLAHFTEAVDFMSEQDKDWVLGRAIMQRLKWS